MSFDSLERSRAAGAPILLVRFTRDFVHWRFTTAQTEQILSAETYVPAHMSITPIKQTAEPAKLRRTITLPHDSPLAAQVSPFPPSDPIGVTIWQRHDGDPETPVEWIGRVVGVEFSGAELRLICEPSSATARRAGRARVFQRGCAHVLYSQGDGLCNADRTLFAVTGQLLSIDGSKVTANVFATQPDGRWAGGYLEWVLPSGLRERRGIEAHTGIEVTLSFPALSLAVGLQVTAFPGCAHTVADCEGFFDNLPNYGGNPYEPQRSPFDGDPLFT